MITSELKANLEGFIHDQMGPGLELAGLHDSDGHAGLTFLFEVRRRMLELRTPVARGLDPRMDSRGGAAGVGDALGVDHGILHRGCHAQGRMAARAADLRFVSAGAGQFQPVLLKR